MKIKEDEIFSNEKLYYRKKISHFQLEDLKILCLYFTGPTGYYVPVEMDYLKVSASFDFNRFKSILMKETIQIEDMAKLIQLFDLKYSLENAIETVKHSAPYIWMDFNKLYFSIE